MSRCLDSHVVKEKKKRKSWSSETYKPYVLVHALKLALVRPPTPYHGNHTARRALSRIIREGAVNSLRFLTVNVKVHTTWQEGKNSCQWLCAGFSDTLHGAWSIATHAVSRNNYNWTIFFESSIILVYKFVKYEFIVLIFSLFVLFSIFSSGLSPNLGKSEAKKKSVQETFVK